MPRPSKSPTWGTAPTFTGGADVGQPVRRDPGAGYRAQGFQAGEVIPADIVNHAIGVLGDWVSYLGAGDWLNWNPIHCPNFTPDTLNVGAPIAMGVRGGQTHPYADDCLVSITNGHSILSSLDGITWRKRTPAVDFVASDHPKSAFWSSAASKWIAAGNSGGTTKIMTAPTAGGTWTARTDPGADTVRRGMAEGAGLVVMCRGAGGFLTSPDGVTWTERAHPCAVKELFGVAYGAGVFVAVGGGFLTAPSDPGCVLTSPDGINWTDRSANIPPALAGAGLRWEDVVYDSTTGLFYACGSSGQVMTSPDGITWTNRSPGSSYGFLGCAVADAGTVYVVATGSSNKHVLRTIDGGLTWAGQTLPWVDSLAGLAVGAGRLVAYGTAYTVDLVGIGLGYRSAVQ